MIFFLKKIKQTDIPWYLKNKTKLGYIESYITSQIDYIP